MAGSPTVCSLLCCSSSPGHSCTTITPLCFIHPAPTFAQFLDRERSPTCSALHDDAITYELVYADGEINEEENMAVAFPSPTPGENSPFFTSYYRPFLWETLPLLNLQQSGQPGLWTHTCRLLSQFSHFTCFISPTPRTLLSQAPGEPRATLAYAVLVHCGYS